MKPITSEYDFQTTSEARSAIAGIVDIETKEEPTFETAQCARCDATLRYELQKGFTELEIFMGACDGADWAERNRELLCAECVKRLGD